MAEKISYERYRIIMRHDFIDDQGKSYEIDDPLSVDYMILRGEKYGMPMPLLINEMMDKLKKALFDLANKEGGEEYGKPFR